MGTKVVLLGQTYLCFLSVFCSYNSHDGFVRTDQLNFAAPSDDEAEYTGGGAYLKKGKIPRASLLNIPVYLFYLYI